MLFFSRPAPPLSPLAALKASLIRVATGLRKEEGSICDVVDLTPRMLLRNAVFVLRKASPLAALLVDNLVPFTVLGFGIAGLFWKDVSFNSFLDSLHAKSRAKIIIPTKHRLHRQLVGWLANHDAVAKSRELMLDISVPHLPKTDPNALIYLPPVKSLQLEYKGRWLTFDHDPSKVDRTNDRDGHEDTSSRIGDITISCFSLAGDTEPIQKLLRDLEGSTKAKKGEKTAIHKVAIHGWGWTPPLIRKARDIHSIAMDTEMRNLIVQEIEEYLKLGNFYKSQGKPHRKGYLLHGPPGTGKTSLVLALAGELGLPLYILSLTNPKLTDALFERLFDQLPSRSIILIEDIDSAGIRRENMSRPRSADNGSNGSKGHAKSNITLSGLLNAIDGPASVEGRILIMTTNAPETLDKALIRDGRIDRRFELSYASKAVAAQLCSRMYMDKNSKVFEDIIPEGITAETVNMLSMEFMAKIPEGKLTPAEIQGFLIRYRTEPRRAVELVEEWCESKLAARDHRGKSSSSSTGSTESEHGRVPVQDEGEGVDEAGNEVPQRSMLRRFFGS